MKHGAACALLAVLVIGPVSAPGQETPETPPDPPAEQAPESPPESASPALRSRWVLMGATALGGIPLGSFGDAVGAGFGVSGYLVGPLRRRQWIAPRFEASWVEYGTRTLDAATGARVKGEYGDPHIVTNNDFVQLALGPQIGFRRGGLRLYAFATVGASYFSTHSTLDDNPYDDDTIASRTNSSDWTTSWSAGGGVLVHLSRQTFLELGVRYLANRPVDWMAPGDVALDAMDPGAQPRHSAANLVEVVVGIAGLP